MAKLSDTSCAILSAERARVINLLPETDPRSDLYGKLLDHLTEMTYVLYDSMDIDERVAQYDEKPAPTEEEPKPKRTRKPAKKEEPPVEEPAVVGVTDASIPPTADQVKEFLADLVHAGKINLPELVKKYIPEGQETLFSNIPVESYAALMEEAQTYAG